MAVPKHRVTRSRRNMRRRSNTSFDPATLTVDQETGETHLRHHVSQSGYYKGKLMVKRLSSESAGPDDS